MEQQAQSAICVLSDRKFDQSITNILKKTKNFYSKISSISSSLSIDLFFQCLTKP